MRLLHFMFTVYVLYSPSFKKIYIGYTSNLNGRFKSHNELGKKGWTIKFRPWIICYKEEFDTKQEAMKRETELKSAKCREWIWSLINEKIRMGLISAGRTGVRSSPSQQRGTSSCPRFYSLQAQTAAIEFDYLLNFFAHGLYLLL